MVDNQQKVWFSMAFMRRMQWHGNWIVEVGRSERSGQGSSGTVKEMDMKRTLSLLTAALFAGAVAMPAFAQSPAPSAAAPAPSEAAPAASPEASPMATKTHHHRHHHHHAKKAMPEASPSEAAPEPSAS
jgi:hypothetical protein